MKSFYILPLGLFFILSSSLNCQTILIDYGSAWSYYDNQNQPVNQGSTDWNDIVYDDSAWSSGNAQLGYGDNDEATLINSNTLVGYFRHEFNVSNPSSYTNLDVDLIYDDGAVVYLNGTEIWRVNMPGGTISYNTFASSTSSDDDLTSTNVTNSLVSGTNVISVEVHQVSANSSDISFDLKLIGNAPGIVNVVRGPYLQTGTPTSMIVRWRTATATESVVRYGTTQGNLTQEVSDLSTKTEHQLTITGLSPNTSYFYEIANSSTTLVPGNSDLYFKTSSNAGTIQPITAWILGDCGTVNQDQRDVRDAYYNYIGSNHTDMILFLGDNAYNDGTDAEYQSAIFENMYENKLKNSVAYSCLGNHDGHTANSNNQTGPYYDIFSFPTNAEGGGIASGTEAYYSFDYGNIHFISLDAYETDRSVGDPMYNWCQNDIQNTTQEWIVAFWHHPPYSKGSHDSDTESNLVEMRQNFNPMLESNGVDLVLGGHSHSYERSYLLNGHYGNSGSFNSATHTVGPTGDGNGRVDGDGMYTKTISGPEAGDGAVYIVTGSAGKNSGSLTNHPAMYSSINEIGSTILEVDGSTMNIKFLRENGVIADYFTLEKESACTSGTACDDGDACTINDIYNTNCDCTGTFQDSDGDGVCDALDQCPGSPYHTLGQSCNDGNLCTINDVVDSNCNCVGTFQDSDGDGICDQDDVCPNFDDGLIGTSCNDGDLCTSTDTYNSNCMCVGTPLPDSDGDGICDGLDQCPGSPYHTIGQLCDDGDLCTINDIVDSNCNCVGTLQDSDGDGVCDGLDQCPGSPYHTFGQSCDDGDLCTINDIVDSNCNCVGTFQDSLCPTCTDGIQNGDETNVDCGGPDCTDCPTCSDGIQNGDETDIDCGGSDCPTCPTCNDGIQNGGETGIDCGGTDCLACPTCSDGIQNGNETGVDCGGPDCNACPINYCSSSANNSSYEYIQQVSVGTISNASGSNGGYADYTNISTNLDENTSYAITLVPGFVNSSYSEYWSVWIDFNLNGSFSDAGELVFQDSGTGTVNGTVAVPSGIQGLSTRMRITMQYNGYINDPCASFTYGEVEDYSVVLMPAVAPTCTDGVQNGNETDIDCGGPNCAACPTCSDGIQNGNETDVDCGGPNCTACPTCSDGVQNGSETGIDCGGADCAVCPTCTDGMQNGNETDIDCGGSNCTACPTCTDGTQNGSETDIDCGGPDCTACPSCTDGIQNGGETDIDCGGPDCPTCPPTCTDGIQNGDETDVDCGGSDCTACPTCTDGVQNGNETDVDCGGPDCPACPTCTDGTQNGSETDIDCGGSDCSACPTCTDGIQNGGETDIDCGGSNCLACPTCSDGVQNGSETDIDCGGPDCSACPTCLDGVQNGNETDIDCGGSDCPACPTCSDGVQNGNETGTDCGGPDCPICPPTCTDGIQNGNETGIDCGGPDCLACSTCIGTVINTYPYSESFENGFGDWTQGSGDDFNWTRQSGGTPSNNTGPSSAIDGTFYMYTESSTPNYSNKTAIFEGSCFDLTSETFAVFNFKYHMNGASNMGSLTFDVSIDDGDTWSTIWSRSSSQGNAWIDASISLQAYLGSTINVRFFGTTGTTWQGDMAIDDISLSTLAPSCANVVSAFPYSESFESGLGLWDQSTDDDLNWVQQTGETPSTGTGPSSAQNVSQYIYIEASSPNYPSKRAIISGPCFDAVSGSELTFYYHMFGSDVGRLDVEVSGDVGVTWTSVWTLSGNQGSSWNAASVDLSAYAGQEIMLRFNGLTGASWQGDICIDNIQILSSASFEDGITLRSKDRKPKANIAPNPFSNYINVRSERPINHIFVYSITGQLVHQNKSNGFIGHTAIDLNNLASGLYLVEIIFEDGESQRNQIIKH